jgi:hypothetical protein
MLGLLLCVPRADAAELARFSIREPLGQTWPEEWLTQDMAVDLGARPVRAGDLALLGPDGASVPAQFYRDGRLLGQADVVAGRASLRVLFKATIRANAESAFVLAATGDSPRRAEGAGERPWPAVAVTRAGAVTRVANGVYEVEFDGSRPLPINALRCASAAASLGEFAWPAAARATGVQDEWPEQGPARAILRRTFRFGDPARAYVLTLDFRAGDPWIGLVDEYALGRGSAIRLDLRAMRPDKVYHPHAYNARTFSPGGDAEDSTLEPPQHPIATLGPIWRDIWYNGGPFAFIYNTGADCGLGLATVRGSRWDAPPGVSLESQNLFVHGDRQTEGQVWVEVPTDGGVRHWAIVLGQSDLRKRMPVMIRRRADIPLDTVLKEWVLDWPSDAPPANIGTFGYLGGNFNEHQKNPTTIPRRVKRAVPASGPVKGRDLAVLAYVFTNPDYWPGPTYKWKIGNPNFHTDMYPVPLLVGLRMPDHPHAGRWVDFGLANVRGQIENDSFPGGSWAESLSYSGAFFSVARYAQMAADAGRANLFRDLPRIKEIVRWFACMETPVDPRYGVRQKAPIGDTSPGNHVQAIRGLAGCYRGLDDRFAEQLRRFPERWEDALDISSREFFGFGAMLRGSPYDERHESFVTIKAGPARNHYQGDELSFYFAALGTPLAIDYACHYSPRPWHAAMHNRPDMNGLRPVAIGARRAFARSEAADVFVADERTREMNHVPLEPHHTTRPGWEYPTTRLPDEKPWTFRRYAMLVKHDPKTSRISDYLVLRDEIESPEPVWWNLHVLAREVRRDGSAFHFPGQLDVDATAHVLAPAVAEVHERRWGWGGSMDARRGKKGKDYETACFGRVIPKDFKRGSWDGGDGHGGEMAQWLRLKGDAGRTDWLVALVPVRQGETAPTVEALSATSARVRLGGETEVVHLGSDGRWQAAVERGGRTTVLLKAGEVRPWAEVRFAPMPPDIDQGAR